jgi:integrase/recombinase XerD
MTIHCEAITHLGRKWIKLDVGDDFPLAALKERLPARHWSASHQAWLVPWREGWLERLREKLGDLAEVVEGAPPSKRIYRARLSSGTTGKRPGRVAAASPALPPEYLGLLEQRGYSPATIRVYLSHFNMFLVNAGNRAPQDIPAEDIRGYFRHLLDEKGVSASYLNQAISAIKIYYEQVLTPPRPVPSPNSGQ